MFERPLRPAPALAHSPERRRLLGGVAAAGLASACAGVLSACGGPRPLSVHGINLSGRDFAKDFHLLDPQGRERSLADFRGKLAMVFFGFTQCPDVCPTALTRAVQIRKRLGADAERLQVIFITVDPERDTPKVLQAYTQAFDPSFLGLYGDAERTAQTAKAFRVVYAKVPTGASYTIDHSALSYVFDASGAIRLALRHEQSAQDCVHDLRQIL